MPSARTFSSIARCRRLATRPQAVCRTSWSSSTRSTGITVAEIDWKARNAGKTPLLDPLAAHIPADQHALFLPGAKAAQAALREFLGGITPILDLGGSPGFDPRFVQARYERQLGVSMVDLARLSGSGLVKGMAVTGSDPYFVTGTDLAILLETDEPGKLVDFLRRTTRSGLPRFIRRDRADGGHEGRLGVRFRDELPIGRSAPTSPRSIMRSY